MSIGIYQDLAADNFYVIVYYFKAKLMTTGSVNLAQKMRDGIDICSIKSLVQSTLPCDEKRKGSESEGSKLLCKISQLFYF